MAGTRHAKAVREPIAVCVKDAAGLHGGEENRGDTVAISQTKYRIIFPALEKWMVENRFSIAEVARLLNRTPDTVSAWLYGDHQPKLSGVWAMVKLTDIPFEELFKEK